MHNPNKGAIFLVMGMLAIVIPTIVLGQSSSGILSIKPVATEENSEIQKLNNEINTKKDVMKRIQSQQDEYIALIEQKRMEKADLGNQLSILENKILQTQLDISRTQIDIDKTNLEIQKTNIEIKNKEDEIAGEKAHIENVIKLISKQDNVNTLEILLLNDSLSDFLNQVQYLEDVNSEIKESLERFKIAKAELEDGKAELFQKNLDLEKLKQELGAKELALKSEIENKTIILEQTEVSEMNYQRLLAQAKQEQENAAYDIINLEKSVRSKMSELEKDKLAFNDNGFIWPVPKNVITSTFHDPDYPFRYIFEHPAIDIRAGQGTPVRAAASGYVARAKDGGKTGYSYIMLIHGDGLSTVYGHVSQLNVKDEDYVMQGQVIGLSGGMPGTPGAGRLTTGPHLHFEVRLNGIPVNPLEYLP